MSNKITSCHHCGQPVKKHWRECPACETPLGSKSRCPQCDEEVEPNWKKCPACQGRLSGSATPSASAEVVAGTNAGSGLFVSGQRQVVTAMLPEIPVGEMLLDRFQIKRLLGNGGFASVYEAQDLTSDRAVALKVSRAVGRNTLAAASDLQHELKQRDRIGDLSHVVRTYDVHACVWMNIPLVMLAMEFASGGSLRKWLQKNKGNLAARQEQGLELFCQACRGVQAIHEAKLVHLDLKPENLLLAREGMQVVVKVTDFGLSRDTARYTLNPAYVKQEGMGTAAYMSPEQIRSARQKDVDGRADIYALGVMLYELLDGHVPFDGSAEEVKRKHLEMAASPLKGVSEQLGDLVMRCLEKDPAKRLQNVDELLVRLDGKLKPDKGRQKEQEHLVREQAPQPTIKLLEAAKRGDLEQVKRNLAHGVKVGTKDKDGNTALHLAAAGGHTQVAAELLAHGAEVDARNQNGSTPLHGAVYQGHIDIAKLLLRAGADADKGRSDRDTPLSLATREGHLEMLHLLLEHGADVNQADIHDATPLLWFAAYDNNLVLARLLLKHKANVNQAYSRGDTALSEATQKGHLEIARMLLEHGANVDRAKDDGNTPLSLAASCNHMEVARLLLQHGADVNHDNVGMTPLREAVLKGHMEIARLLLEHGADVNHTTAGGFTPLDWADEDPAMQALLRSMGGRTWREELARRVDGMR